MPRPKNVLVVVLVILAFAAGFGAATLRDRGGLSAPASAQVALYRQVLSDLQHDYYKPINLAQLGQSGISGLIASLHDPYTDFFTPQQAKAFSDELSGSYTGIGTAVVLKSGRFTVTEVFAGSPAAQAKIRAGDVIVSIDGTPTLGKSIGASVDRILGPAGSQVHLQVRQPGIPGLLDLTLTRRAISLPLTSSRLIDDHGTQVGYVALSAFAQGAGQQVGRALASLQARGARWLILDLRNNGGGLVSEAVNVVSDFLPAGKVVVSTQGLHSAKAVLKTGAGNHTRLPLVLLVNGNTASASEILTGALQDHRRATVIGTRTFGKGVVQTVLNLAGGNELKITIAADHTPLGRNFNHIGLEPAIVVVQNPRSTSDQVLARALRFIARREQA
jgi:carboxyl-terminal processing protease